MPRRTYTDGGDVDLDRDSYTYGGERLTEERAEQLGRQAADRAIAKRERGRPSLATGHSPQIAVRVPQSIKDRLAEIATRDGVRESDLVRSALDEYLGRREAS